MIVNLTKSKRNDKKYTAIFNYNNKKYIVHFGGIKENGEPYEDYTTHRDRERQQRYIKRHKIEARRWEHKKDNLKYPSYWSRWLLWEKPNLKDAMKNIENKLKIKIIFI